MERHAGAGRLNVDTDRTHVGISTGLPPERRLKSSVAANWLLAVPTTKNEAVEGT
jgi:hypothetical protein